jgi:hypothetical protein
MAPGADAVAYPDGARAQRAAQLTAARQVDAVAGPQGEVLRLARQVTAQVMLVSLALLRGWRRRAGEPIVGVGPGVGLLGIEPRGCHLVRKLSEPMTAALADGGEGLRVPRQVQRDLVRLSRPVTAGHSGHGQHGAIDAA